MSHDLNGASHGAGLAEASARRLPIYRTAIGDAIFPGDDVHTLRLRSDFSEMLLSHLQGGGALDLTAIGDSLARFTPSRVSKTTHPAWKECEALEWEQCERPRIFSSIEDFFLNGGLQRRMDEQRMFFLAIQEAGIQLGNTALLFDQALHSGEWRATFIRLAVMGRRHGIQLSGSNIDRPRVSAALHSAGFSREQQQMIWGSLRESWPSDVHPGIRPIEL